MIYVYRNSRNKLFAGKGIQNFLPYSPHSKFDIICRRMYIISSIMTVRRLHTKK